MVRFVLVIAGAVAIASAVGYAVWRGLGGSGDPAERAREQIAQGALVYSEKCASCHDAEGGIGPRLEAAVIASYRTGSTLFNYLQLAMPYDAPGSLSEAEYLQVLAYLLDTRQLLIEPVVVDVGTLEQISFSN